MGFRQKIFDGFVAALACGVGFLFISVLQSNSELSARVETQRTQASSLIQEVGETKEENELLFQKLRAAEADLLGLKGVYQASGKIEDVKIPRLVAAHKPDAEPADSDQGVPISGAPGALLSAKRNFLVVGHHNNLADSIVAVIADPAKQEMAYVSVPRDLFVNGRKLSEYLSLYGPGTLREKVSQATGIEFEADFILDFRAFETIVDALGGVYVSTDRAIYDARYPDDTGGYTLYSLPAGNHLLNGAEALKFVRSRHSTSDFDRAARQQKILGALKERISRLDLLENLNAVKNLYGAIEEHVDTDVGFLQGLSLILEFRNFRVAENLVLSTANVLSSSVSISGQYILLPKNGDWGEVKKFVREALCYGTEWR